MKYYIDVNGQQQGPFEKEELLAHGLTANSYVWCQTMQGWTRAGEVDDLADLLAQQAAASPEYGQPQYAQPQYSQPQYSQPQYAQQSRPVMPQSYLAWAILVTIFCCLPFGIVGIVYASKVSGLYYRGLYNEAEQASANAKRWTMIGFICGLVYYVLIACLYGYLFAVGGGIDALANI